MIEVAVIYQLNNVPTVGEAEPLTGLSARMSYRCVDVVCVSAIVGMEELIGEVILTRRNQKNPDIESILNYMHVAM